MRDRGVCRRSPNGCRFRLEAVRSAQEEGIVIGGGCALLKVTNNLLVKTNNQEQALGAIIVQEACKEPIRQMALNAGESPDLIVVNVLKAAKDEGWDFKKGELADLLLHGIVDPVKVTRVALQNAASCAGTLITTNYGIVQL